MNTTKKGRRNEKRVCEILEPLANVDIVKSGRPAEGYTDVLNFADVLAVLPESPIKLIQVKTGKMQGRNWYEELAEKICSNHIDLEIWIAKEDNIWRIYRYKRENNNFDILMGSADPEFIVQHYPEADTQ